MKRTIFLSVILLFVISALNFSTNNINNVENKAMTFSVKICFDPTCSAVPPDTKAHVYNSSLGDFGECELTGGNCCIVSGIPNGTYHIHFTQNGSTFCDGSNFTVN